MELIHCELEAHLPQTATGCLQKHSCICNTQARGLHEAPDRSKDTIDQSTKLLSHNVTTTSLLLGKIETHRVTRGTAAGEAGLHRLRNSRSLLCHHAPSLPRPRVSRHAAHAYASFRQKDASSDGRAGQLAMARTTAFV